MAGMIDSKRVDNNLTRLDMETKVALMAALIWNGNNEAAVSYAIAIEEEVHRRVVQIFRDRKRD